MSLKPLDRNVDWLIELDIENGLIGTPLERKTLKRTRPC